MMGHIPVLIISHGLASGRTDFVDLAQYLVSHGFAVAVVEHPGSDRQQFRNLLAGKAQEVMNPSEFVDRPLDVTFLLNQLEQHSPQVNFKHVGIIGHSFGGYTALALAGAPLDLENIQRLCQSNQSNPSSIQVGNPSLLLQCQANKLPGSGSRSLRDSRIQMVIALNPVLSHLLGAKSLSQVQIPTLMIGGSDDLIAPVLLEQICPFSQIGSLNKYLAIVEKGTHFFAEAEPLAEGLSLPQTVSGTNLQLKSQYIKMLSLTFAEGFLTNQPEYRRYLNSASVTAMSQSRLPIQFLGAFGQTRLPISVQKACSTP